MSTRRSSRSRHGCFTSLASLVGTTTNRAPSRILEWPTTRAGPLAREMLVSRDDENAAFAGGRIGEQRVGAEAMRVLDRGETRQRIHARFEAGQGSCRARGSMPRPRTADAGPRAFPPPPPLLAPRICQHRDGNASHAAPR